MEWDQWGWVGLMGQDGDSGAGLGYDWGRMGPCRAGQDPAGQDGTCRSGAGFPTALPSGLQQPHPHPGGARTPVPPRQLCHRARRTPAPLSRARVPVCGSAPPGPAVPRRRPRGRPPAGPPLHRSPALSDAARGPPAPPGQRSSRPGEDEGPGAAPRAPRAAVTLSWPDRGCGPRALRRDPRLFREDLAPAEANRVLQESGEGSGGGGWGLKRTPPAPRHRRGPGTAGGQSWRTQTAVILHGHAHSGPVHAVHAPAPCTPAQPHAQPHGLILPRAQGVLELTRGRGGSCPEQAGDESHGQGER